MVIFGKNFKTIFQQLPKQSNWLAKRKNSNSSEVHVSVICANNIVDDKNR